MPLRVTINTTQYLQASAALSHFVNRQEKGDSPGMKSRKLSTEIYRLPIVINSRELLVNLL